jgi:peroxiredoxin
MKAKLWLKQTPALLLSLVLAQSLSQCLPPSAAAEGSGSATTPAAAVSESTSLLGKTAPVFSLNDSNGKKRSLSDFANKVVVLEWTNFDCPYVAKHYSAGDIQKLQKTYSSKGVVWCSICSSADGRQGNYPAAKINELIKQNNATPTAYLFDLDGAVGRSYGAAMTPQIFVINQKGIIVYSGAIDDNASADITDKANTNYVQKALDETLANKPVSVSDTKAVGCSVKYKG